MNVMEFISAWAFFVVLMLAAACFMILLVGCSAAADEPTGDKPAATGSALVFSVAEGTTRGAATRTAPGTITTDGTGSTVSLREKGFGVFACHTGAHPYVSTSTTANLLYNQLVAYDDAEGQWQYAPLVYWPNGTTGDKDYVSFFAYAPYSDTAAGCIVDMSRDDETGDPWLLYQLGGTSNANGASGWKAQQVDLLYDFVRDQQKGDTPSTRVNLNFKHALAAIGDRITVTCDESVADRLKAVYEDSPVTLTVTQITLDYLLTRKGRLVLNGSTQPNWQAVESEDAQVHRTLTFMPNLAMVQATSASDSSITPFDSGAGHGIFYIPIESGSSKQQLTTTIHYTISSGAPAVVTEEGEASTTLDLSFLANASEGRDLNITFRIP